MITRASMRVEAVRRSINHFLLCSVLSKRTRQLAIHNPNSRIAELIGLACHEFMDDKLSFVRLAVPAAPIKDADMLQVRRQSGAARDEATPGTNCSRTGADSESPAVLHAAVQTVAAHAAPGGEVEAPSRTWRTTR